MHLLLLRLNVMKLYKDMNHVKNNIIKKINLRDLRMASLFVLPLVTFITLLIVVPILGTLVNSLFQDVTFLNKKFIFLENYIRLFQRPRFWRSTEIYGMVYSRICSA